MLISSSLIQLTPPNPDHAEISLFGPGIGECIVLHYGNGRWFIIDSCLCPETKQPIALAYLNSIGVDASTQVTGILITHWHSDHIEGAFALLKTCRNAKLYHSGALSSREAFHLAAIYKKDIFSNIDREIREFSNIVQFLFDAKDKSRLDPIKARLTFFDYRDDIQTRMIALSPSSTAVTQSISKLVELIPKNNSDRLRNVIPESENLNSVAIHFTFGRFSTVLGSDLEETGNMQTGWSAIFNSNIISELSLPASSLYKVSHHGSETGHHDKIWTDLMIDNPLSITTPFRRCGLPTPANIERVTAISSEFIITRDPASAKTIKRDNMVDREMKAVTKERIGINEKMGHIQVRVSHGGEMNIAANKNCVRHIRRSI